MKTLTALAATAVALLALTGCATAASAATAAKPPAAPVVAQIETTNIYRHVHSAWKGDEKPSKPWIDDAAMLVCKQLIGGIEPRILMGGNRIDQGNNRVIVLAAQKFVCDR